jgi:diaminohydroxyphosphoribosylaminopyrimidine deaminase/5-amino-6-(5-phosphoribosylamino)uracil reductase
MSSAIQLAMQGRFTVSPNPMAGCILVKDDKIIGQGFHQQAGGPHAEVIALQQAGGAAKDATAYITLEPCCHFGRTPPCTHALIKAGVKTVYVACKDPNPLVAGKGLAELQAAGIAVQVGLHEKEAIELNEIFFHYIQHKKPFVFSKWAMSLDGKTITHAKDDKAISHFLSHQHAHQLRQQVDAILIGANTAIQDDPLLTVRYASGVAPTKHPLRIIVTGRALPAHLRLFDGTLPGKTLIATTEGTDKNWNALRDKNIEILALPENADKKVSLPDLLTALGKREITSLLVEGGATLHQAFFQENLVNKIHVYVAPVIIGALEKKRPLCNVQVSALGNDFYFTAKSERPSCLLE